MRARLLRAAEAALEPLFCALAILIGWYLASAVMDLAEAFRRWQGWTR